ncbi:hypothetical protein PVK64_19905 [Aliivibrio sp. S4TY2]|uniref:hypothetical protein n=1 Tax=unclassified Aliivibrio TaxID=2645654 RepID=UPI00237802A8|nr:MULTISPECIES: hypothetical protein [unclassified Aliivibrio]MDD9158432.1 hypothetical protein [Aliivibrio sp. S4TY2]MDD9162432.1 hypothetical protein [Aliivibrio sp. S4TY1]MDD9166439.1 hypothetical protein [Aliivibrio sp. S4MY2]MDD9170431.1 hypothetical protein [Aliivibrio sp. S4MY4]MDD9187518.1 hypothetical protein [Aliivibrio sp. S4MY3]
MKPTLLSVMLAASFCSSALATSTEQNYFKSSYQDIYENIGMTLESLRQLADIPKNIVIEGLDRYLLVNGEKYLLNNDNYILFDFPIPFNDESAFRNVFNFIGNEWELTWYDNGLVVTNKYFGNYEYGDGCLLEYYPNGVIKNGQIERIVLETSSCSLNNFNTNIEYFERGKTISANDMGLENLNITAVERYQDRLYVTHDTDPGTVVILDVDTGQVLSEIKGFEANDVFYPFRRLNELYIQGNLLYVASLNSNRVDIFNLDNQHQHVTTLGGSGPTALFRPQATVSNKDYVIVAGASEKISVYRQQDVTAENHLKAPIHAVLQFEGQYTHRKVQMHVLEHYLMVVTANKNYYIYDLNDVESAVSSGEALIPKKIINTKLQKVDKSGDQLVVNHAGRLEWHNIVDVIANDFVFSDPTRIITHLDANLVNNLYDVHYNDGELVTATQSEIRFDQLRSYEVPFIADQQVETTKILFDQLMPTSVNEVLSLDEPHSLVTNPALRSVNVNSLIKTEFIDTDTVQITNYAAVELKDLTVELKLAGIEKWFVLTNIDRLPAYAQITLPLSAFGQGQFNSSNDDGYFDLADLFSSTMNYSKQFEHRFNSDTDLFAKKLARLKPTWEIRFASNHTGNWRMMNALYAREWLIILTNLAYIVSEDEFEHVWFNFKNIFGYDMHANAGPVDAPGGFFTEQDYRYWYNGLMNRAYVNGGVTSIGGGLGGAGITGVDTWMFYTHYYGTWGVIAHEFGHGFDGKATYGHHTSFANGSNGWHPLITALANYHIRKGDLPYTDDSINGFYKPEYQQYRHNGIDNNKRKHRSDTHMYLIDDYFMTYSNIAKNWATNGEQTNVQTVAAMNNQERILMAKSAMGSEKPYLCRFTFEDGEQYYGYVMQDNKEVSCRSGDDINYRQSNGSHVALQSKANEFDWLSLYNPEQKGELVLHQNGQPLCQIDNPPFYGTGFVNEKNQCAQLPNVYWSNGNRWAFSSGWTTLEYK